MFTALCHVEYRIENSAALTVGERDQLLGKYQAELQTAVANMSKEELRAQDIKQTLQGMADALAKKLSSTALIFESTEVGYVEVHDNGQEYQG
jgi:hypothetical protein